MCETHVITDYTMKPFYVKILLSKITNLLLFVVLFVFCFHFFCFRSVSCVFCVFMTDTSVPLASVNLLSLSESSWAERACLLTMHFMWCMVLT